MATTVSERQGVKVDIYARKGADLHRRFRAQYYSGETLMDFDLTQYASATMQVRRKPNSPITELSLSTSDGSIVLGTDGRYEIKINAEAMDKIRAGEYYYDLILSNNTYSKRDFIYGSFFVQYKITN